MKVYLKKKVFGANGYQIKVYKTKKSKKAILTKTTTKLKITLKTNKMRERKNLYVRVRAYQNVNGKKVYGKWSAVKKTTTK